MLAAAFGKVTQPLCDCDLRLDLGQHASLHPISTFELLFGWNFAL
jgi:hypothetical protein